MDRPGAASWAWPNLLVAGIVAAALVLDSAAPDVYRTISQEDHWIEWSTVWAFLLATLIYARAARQAARRRGGWPWFHTALAAFCFLVAMEEISWGQRLFSYRPPAYFLADNFQQELNLHNIVDTRWRQWALQGVILGYGVLLPLASAIAPLARLLSRAGIAPPPWRLVPAFAMTSAMYFFYPLQSTGEWVELMLGLCFVFAAAEASGEHGQGALNSAARFAAPAAAVLVLGALTLWLTTWLYAASPQTLARAQAQVAALALDFAHERVATRCGVHKRIYTFQSEYGQSYLRQGAFANHPSHEGEAARARFFLDPWNMPYWVRHLCTADRGRQVVYVYSFGPNRRRDSIGWEITADDIGLRVTQEARGR